MKIGVDLGGTKTEAVLLDRHNKLIKKIRTATPAKQGYEALLNNISNMVKALDAHASILCPIGIGTPGSIDKNSKRLKYSNTVCLNDKPILSDLEQILRRPVRIENDANCFAFSEAIDGSGQNHNIVFGIIMGTGVGGGIVVNKSIVNGPNSMTGEWGHSVLDHTGNPCYCGLNGCIETYLSGPGLINHFINNGGASITAVEQLLELANNNDATALKTLDNFYTDFARAVSQIVKFIDPDIIVLGGGLSNIDSLYTTAVERINRFFSVPISINLQKNRHGDSSGVRGAAYLWDN